MRGRCPGCGFKILPVVIGTLGGGVWIVLSDMSNLLTEQELVIRTVAEMQTNDTDGQ